MGKHEEHEYDPLEGVPPDEALADRTISEEAELLSHDAEYSNELSDLSEQEEARRWRSMESLSIYTFYRQLRPLMKSPQVRVLALLNCIITLVNLILLITVLAFVGVVVYHKISYDQWNALDMPCIYEWSAWSNCSHHCARDGVQPKKVRHITKETIVQARGSKRECPSDLEKWKDEAPCNTHACPKNLTSFTDMTPCFYKNPMIGKEGGCYRMRDIPTEDGLIHIDTKEYYWDCEDDECPENMQ